MHHAFRKTGLQTSTNLMLLYMLMSLKKMVKVVKKKYSVAH